LKTSLRLDDDFLAWQPEKSGIFTVRSAYNLGLELQQQESDLVASSHAPLGNKIIWKVIWKSRFPEKGSHFCMASLLA
jgi:hypothetical protein